MNQCAFRHSARNLPLSDSMKALSVGLWWVAMLGLFTTVRRWWDLRPERRLDWLLCEP
jgi:hypothetical protein